MALFGRDSLITSFQALPYLPGLAATTLRVLAARQADARDDFHEQEPGKILHELRFGELTARRRATAFAVLRQRRRDAAVPDPARRVPPLVRRRLAGAGARAERPRGPCVDRRTAATSTATATSSTNAATPTTGLINQCWKDSWNSIQFADGTARAGTDRDLRDPGLRRTTRSGAPRAWRARSGATRRSPSGSSAVPATCATRFRRDFWMPERGCYALALDGDKRQVDSLTSNIGHLLWSGILDDGEAAATAERLLDEELYSGWGVRTLGTREAGYNPLGYHTGTVWPHDNSLIAAGLARYGHHEAAATIASRDPRRGAVLRASAARGLRRLSRGR